MIAYEQTTPGQRAVVALCLVVVWLLVLGAPLVRSWWERRHAQPVELVDWERNGWTSGDDVAGLS